MSLIARVSLLFLTASTAFAQLDSNSITVSASRGTTIQADQVVFAITVSSSLDVNLTDVVAAVQSAGLTLSNFQSVATALVGVLYDPSAPLPAAPPPRLQWVFALPVPISKLKDTTATLTTLQQSIAKNNNGMTMSFSVAGTQVSVPLQQSQTFVEKLKGAGVEAKLVVKEGAGHGWFGIVKDMEVLADWFDRHLKKTGDK